MFGGQGGTRTRLVAPLDRCERALLWLITFSCFTFALVTPPFQVPDEPQHLSRALQLASGHIFAERRARAVGGTEPRGFADLSERDFPREGFDRPTRYGWSDLVRAARGRPDSDRPTFIEFANVAGYAPSLYLPQMLGIVLGRSIGVSPLAIFYVVRLFNVALSVALLWLATLLLPAARKALLAIAALPTVAYQAGSVSPDATINAVTWLTIALSLAVAAAPGDARRGWMLAAAAVPLGLAKGLYAPLTLAGARRGAWAWCGAAVLIAASAFLAWTWAAGGDQPLYAVVSRRTGALVMTAPLSAQLRVVLGDPIRFGRVLVSSMGERSPVYALQLVGRFGWNAILLPLLGYLIAAVMLAAGALAGLGARVSVATRLRWAAIALVGAVLVETALYLTGTPLDADYVQGTQGRYFLPVLPLLLLALAPAAAMPRINASRWLFGSAFLLHVLAIATAVDAFWIHGFTTFHGLPPIGHGAAGIWRALFLPSPRW